MAVREIMAMRWRGLKRSAADDLGQISLVNFKKKRLLGNGYVRE